EVAAEGVDRGPGQLAVARLAGRAPQAQQDARHDAVARGQRTVEDRLETDGERLVRAIGGEEPAARRVGEAPDGGLGQRAGLRLPAGLPGRVVQVEETVGQV